MERRGGVLAAPQHTRAARVERTREQVGWLQCLNSLLCCLQHLQECQECQALQAMQRQLAAGCASGKQGAGGPARARVLGGCGRLCGRGEPAGTVQRTVVVWGQVTAGTARLSDGGQVCTTPALFMVPLPACLSPRHARPPSSAWGLRRAAVLPLPPPVLLLPPHPPAERLPASAAPPAGGVGWLGVAAQQCVSRQQTLERGGTYPGRAQLDREGGAVGWHLPPVCHQRSAGRCVRGAPPRAAAATPAPSLRAAVPPVCWPGFLAGLPGLQVLVRLAGAARDPTTHPPSTPPPIALPTFAAPAAAACPHIFPWLPCFSSFPRIARRYGSLPPWEWGRQHWPAPAPAPLVAALPCTRLCPPTPPRPMESFALPCPSSMSARCRAGEAR